MHDFNVCNLFYNMGIISRFLFLFRCRIGQRGNYLFLYHTNGVVGVQMLSNIHLKEVPLSNLCGWVALLNKTYNVSGCICFLWDRKPHHKKLWHYDHKLHFELIFKGVKAGCDRRFWASTDIREIFVIGGWHISTKRQRVSQENSSRIRLTLVHNASQFKG